MACHQEFEEHSGIEKLGNAKFTSWITREYMGRWIVPEPLDQKYRKICVLCAFIHGGQMELNKEVARGGGRCDIKFMLESLVRDFVKLHGVDPLAEDGYEREREVLMEGRIEFNPPDASGWIFKHHGVEATSPSWPKTPLGEDVRRRLAIEDYRYYKKLSFEALNFLDAGKLVLATLAADKEFDNLEEDEIYRWRPKYDANGKMILAVGHMVMLVGHGESEHGDGFHPFLNSYGDSFGGDGGGFVFYDELAHFYVLSIKANPKVITQPPPPDLPLPAKQLTFYLPKGCTANAKEHLHFIFPHPPKSEQLSTESKNGSHSNNKQSGANFDNWHRDRPSAWLRHDTSESSTFPQPNRLPGRASSDNWHRDRPSGWLQHDTGESSTFPQPNRLPGRASSDHWRQDTSPSLFQNT